MLGHPDTYRDKGLQECSLQVRQDVDLFSVGCVLSEVALWVCHGWEAVEIYRTRRSSEVEQKTGKREDLFHADREILKSVRLVHQDVQHHRLCNESVTPGVTNMIEKQLMVIENAPTSKVIYDKSGWLISHAKDQMEPRIPAAEDMFRELATPRATRPNIASIDSAPPSDTLLGKSLVRSSSSESLQNDQHSVQNVNAKFPTSSSSTMPTEDRQRGPQKVAPRRKSSRSLTRIHHRRKIGTRKPQLAHPSEPSTSSSSAENPGQPGVLPRENQRPNSQSLRRLGHLKRYVLP